MYISKGLRSQCTHSQKCEFWPYFFTGKLQLDDTSLKLIVLVTNRSVFILTDLGWYLIFFVPDKRVRHDIDKLISPSQVHSCFSIV